MENPVDFLNSPNWHKPDRANALIKDLEQLGFKVSQECCEIKAMNLQALALLHKNEKHFAVIYEDANTDLWLEVGIQAQRCKIGRDAWGKKYFIAISSANDREWTYDSKEIIRLHDATASELLQQVNEMIGDIPADTQDSMMLGMLLHDRLYQKWVFVNEEKDPNQIKAENDSRKKKLSKWVVNFIKFYRPLGFLKNTEKLSDAKLKKIILDYDEPLFDLCRGTEAVVDDYDEFADLFSEDELDLLPETTQYLDLKILAVLDPERVWWQYRKWNFDIGYIEKDITIDGEQFLKSLAGISNERFAPESIEEVTQKNKQSEIVIQLDGKTHRLQNNYITSTEYISREARLIVPDIQILSEINAVLPGKDTQFHLFAYDKDVVPYIDENEEDDHEDSDDFDFDDLEEDNDDEEGYFLSKYIILLSKKDHKILKDKRGWKFK